MNDDFQREPSSLLSQLQLWLRVDFLLLFLLLLLMGLGLFVIYSAGGESISLMTRQAIRFGIALGVMFIIAQIPSRVLHALSPWAYGVGLIMLILVLLVGDIGKGAQRWLEVGGFRFQPSELMKLAVPMMIAWFFADRPLPPRLSEVIVGLVFILVPGFLIAKQPDLGTSLLVSSAGIFVVFLAGVSWRYIAIAGATALAALPVFWHFFMHEYQQRRVLMLLDPESDPLGAGYHIIQSKIAIGSGGFYGKGWLNGTQSQLEFLPERHTDFIFAVYGEEFGYLGVIILLALYLAIIMRGLYIAMNAQDTYSRLLAGSLGLIFFVYLFVNIGMVSGLLPVVGVPLPLISYGGTSMVTLMAGFGILMSIQSRRRLLAQ